MIKNFIIPLLIATLSGMGVGGGGLLVIYLSLIGGVGQVEAQGLNLCFFILSAAASTVFNAKKGKIYWKITLVLSASGILFSLLGSFIAGEINSELLRKIFGIMLILGGAISLFSGRKSRFVKKTQR